MEPKDFKMCYLLKSINNQKDTLIDKVFDSAIDQLNWYQEKIKNLSEIELTTAIAAQKIYDNDIIELNYAKNSALISVVSDDEIIFSFNIKNKKSYFNKKNEEGKRMWLRQHLDDIFSSYISTGLLEKSYDENLTKELRKEYKEILNAFNFALKNAYYLKSKSFWIDNEVSNKIFNLKK